MFGPGFLADLVLGKYLYHQPLYRQAQGLERESGVKLSPATLCQTVGRLADAVELVTLCMPTKLWQGGYAQMDLSPVRCLSREHDGGSFFGQWRPGGRHRQPTGCPEREPAGDSNVGSGRARR